MWAATSDPLPPPPVMILGSIGSIQHPRPLLAQTSFGTMLPFHTAPTSLPTTAPSDMIPQQPSSRHGTSLYRTQSTHPSLYNQSRNPSPAPQWPISTWKGAVAGETSDPQTVPCEQTPGNDSLNDSKSSHNLHQSYLCPLSCATETGQARRAVQTPLGSHHAQPCHSPIQRQSSMESMTLPSHPLSRRAVTPLPSCLPTPVRNLHTNIHAALTIMNEQDPDLPIPQELTRAEYPSLYNYFTYELSFVLTWGRTQAGNDYFMKKQQGLPADEILQYVAE